MRVEEKASQRDRIDVGCDWASLGARLRACRVHAYTAFADMGHKK